MMERGGITTSVNEAGLYTLSQAARMIRRSPHSIRRWVRNEAVPHPETMKFGELEVWVFSLTDIARLQEERDKVVWGRPPKAGLKPLVTDKTTGRPRPSVD